MWVYMYTCNRHLHNIHVHVCTCIEGFTVITSGGTYHVYFQFGTENGKRIVLYMSMSICMFM